jgi:hypothetical protein
MKRCWTGSLGRVWGVLPGLVVWGGTVFGAPNPVLPQMPAQPEDIRDILPPVDIPVWTSERLMVAGVGAALVLGLLLWALVAWSRRERTAVPPPAPGRVALEALTRLKGAEGAALEARDFAAQVAEILRRFLEATYGIQATRQTTSEFLSVMETHAVLDHIEREQLRRFLELCDQLKFARAEAAVSAREGLIHVAEQQVAAALKPKGDQP